MFIFLGIELLRAFFWTAYLFGAFLIYPAYKMAFDRREPAIGRRRAVTCDIHRLGDALARCSDRL